MTAPGLSRLPNLCMCVLYARTASGPDPLVARLAAEVVALRHWCDVWFPDLQIDDERDDRAQEQVARGRGAQV